MNIYDCHVHTTYSNCGKVSMQMQCERAMALGLSAVTFTDHNYPAPKGYGPCENVIQSVKEAKKMQEVYQGKLQIFCGVEMADISLDVFDNTTIYQMDGLDCVLGSIHSKALIKRYIPDAPCKTLMGLGENIDMDFARDFMQLYFLEMVKMVKEADIDVLAHLTYPLRYINGDGHKNMQMTEFFPVIDEILDVLIDRDISLEVNTSGFARGWNEFIPQEDIIRRYYEKGGRNITTGSDSHRTETLSVGIPEAIQLLKKIGFTHGSYYQNRKRKTYQL